MNIKRKLSQAVKLYFMLVTFISVLLMVLGLLFDADRTFSYSVFASPLIYAAIGVIPVFLPGQNRELSVKGLIIKRVVEVLVIEGLVMLIVFSSDNIPSQNRSVVIGIAAGIVVIYLIVNAIEYLYEKKIAEELNVLLLNVQKEEEQE